MRLADSSTRSAGMESDSNCKPAQRPPGLIQLKVNLTSRRRPSVHRARHRPEAVSRNVSGEFDGRPPSRRHSAASSGKYHRLDASHNPVTHVQATQAAANPRRSVGVIMTGLVSMGLKKAFDHISQVTIFRHRTPGQQRENLRILQA